ncbi:MAG: hypothetical protein DRJ42_25805 [Deltaproteobacteria bacterium]|nr:MAG: hypothetical protein DRJ42_25805 [Deltaproteobacteria bacterium]
MPTADPTRPEVRAGRDVAVIAALRRASGAYTSLETRGKPRPYARVCPWRTAARLVRVGPEDRIAGGASGCEIGGPGIACLAGIGVAAIATGAQTV